MVEPSRAGAVVLPRQATVGAPAATGVQVNPCSPAVVEITATGVAPIGVPTGMFAVSVQVMPLPLTVPVTRTTWPACVAEGWPDWPLGLTCGIACCTVIVVAPLVLVPE